MALAQMPDGTPVTLRRSYLVFCKCERGAGDSIRSTSPFKANLCPLSGQISSNRHRICDKALRGKATLFQHRFRAWQATTEGFVGFFRVHGTADGIDIVL